MNPSPAQIERAKQKEQWILRTAAGEDPEVVRQELGLAYKVSYLRHLRARYEQGGRTWEALLDRRHRHANKGTPEVKAFLFEQKRKQPDLTGPELRKMVWDKFQIDISISRLNELLHAEELSNPPGRPPRRERVPVVPQPTAERELDNAGLFFPQGSVSGIEHPGRV